MFPKKVKEITPANKKYYDRASIVRMQLKHIEKLLGMHDIRSGAAKHWGLVGDLEKASELLGRVEAIFS